MKNPIEDIADADTHRDNESGGDCSASPCSRPADWRELTDLLEEILHIHSFDESPGYNECDKAPCLWCEQAREWVSYLKNLDANDKDLARRALDSE